MNNNKTDILNIRITPKIKNRLRQLANTYAGGNMSLWVEHAILNAPREFIKDKNDQFKIYSRIEK